MHIELHRTFLELLRDDEKGDDAQALSSGNATLTLPDLLSMPRVVILSEAGSGKTEEIREATRRLKADGRAAFFLRLEHVAVDFDAAFEEGTLEEFKAWLTSSEQGWVLLDSVDESRLRSPQDFALAMRKVSKQLASAKQRTHLLVTGRAPAWRPRTDLELCEKLFPVADVHAAPMSYGDVESMGEHKQVIPVTGACFKVVTMQDLSAQQIKIFAEAKGIEDTVAFLDAIERADARSFTARPQDLDELTGFWLDNGVIGSRLELMKNSVQRRLKEPDQNRAESQPMARERALEGIYIIAAALVLTNQQTIQVPDGTQCVQGLRLDALLMNWTEKEISTLLQRPLFSQDIYGAVRFHHRSVKEYLAAQWFLKLLSQEVSRRKVEELFFREQYGLEVVVPSLRPLLPWLAMVDNRILVKIRLVAPAIVFEGGDPVQLPAYLRSSLLEQICEQLASGASTRSMADFAAIQRFAAPDLTDTLRRLVQKYKDNDDIVFFLMKMVWQGRLQGALPETMNIGYSPNVSCVSRIAAFRAIADVGTSQDMASIRNAFCEERSPLNRRCLAELVRHVSQPDEQALQWLMECIPRLTDYNQYEATGLSEAISSFFERASLQLVYRGMELLHELLTVPPLIERRYCAISQRHQWLQPAAGVAAVRLINARDAAALKPISLVILHMLEIGAQYNVRAFEIKKLGLAEAIQHWGELKWALFWHIVDQERKSKATIGERVVDCWGALVTIANITFDISDFDTAARAISERKIADDKLVALSLACRLYILSGRKRNLNSQIEKAIGGDDALRTFFAALKKPPKISAEIKRMEREHVTWSRREATQRAQEETARLEAPAKLETQLDTLRNPGFDDPSAISQAQHYLYNRMLETEENREASRWGNYNWRALEREFGIKTPSAFRDGIVRYWRGHTPKLVSEGAPLNSTSLADLFGLAGLSIEAKEDQMLFEGLSPAEAAAAFRYAMRELNGFPHWFPALVDAHPDVVKVMTLTEVNFELQSSLGESLSHYIIFDLSHYGDWLWDSIAPDILRLLRTHSSISAERLLHLLGIVQASRLPDTMLVTLATEMIASAGEHLPLWLALWTGIAPAPAIDALEVHLATLGDASARTEFTKRYITFLLGGDGIAARVRTGFCSPSVLRRLYLLVHEHVRYREDVDRANMGAYSPDLRDQAQGARERLVAILKDIPGRDAYLALKAISECHPEPLMRPWFVLQAKTKAEIDSERPAWSVEQVSQFERDFERTPTNHRELFDLAVLRLQDLKQELEHGDASTASVLINAERETVVRNYIGVWCSRTSLGRYIIAQEEELPDAKRPDLRWHSFAFNGPVPTELKIADNWRGPQLFERLEGQLAGDYLRDDASSRGIYLLVYRGVQKHWQLPSGEMANFGELVTGLQEHWASVAMTHHRVEEIKVIGIDLTKRAETPLPKKRLNKRNAVI